MPDWLSWDFWAKDSQSLNHLALIIAGVIGIPLLAIRTFAANRSARAALDQAKTTAQRHDEQTKADRERRITESFAKAVEQLGSDKLETRLGGIYTLERIARESGREYWPIMETLTAFVRERAPWPPRQAVINPFVELQSSSAVEESRPAEQADKEAEPLVRFWPASVEVRPATDIQAILTVLGRRSEQARKWGDTIRRRLDLSGTCLQGANLWEAHLERANFWKAHLENANLGRAHLERASFVGAHLERAELGESQLQGANFQEAHLEGAGLFGAHLERAWLWEAHLEGALLREAHLEDALLREAHLEGADLRDAVGLTQEQLARAVGDAATKVVNELRPSDWPPAAAEEPDNAR